MKVTIEVHKIEATGQVKLDMPNVEAAKEKALEMARAHTIGMDRPEEEYIAVVVNRPNGDFEKLRTWDGAVWELVWPIHDGRETMDDGR